MDHLIQATGLICPDDPAMAMYAAEKDLKRADQERRNRIL